MTQPTQNADPVLALLDAERASFLAAVARVPAAQQSRRAAPDRWSVVEIVEHVARIDVGVAREALRAAYLSADPAVLDGAVHEHPVIGPLTLRGWFGMAAHHDARHAAQIAELADELR